MIMVNLVTSFTTDCLAWEPNSFSHDLYYDATINSSPIHDSPAVPVSPMHISSPNFVPHSTSDHISTQSLVSYIHYFY